MYRLISDMCMRAAGRAGIGRQAGRQVNGLRRGKGESGKHNRMRVRTEEVYEARGISQRENDGDDCDEFVEL